MAEENWKTKLVKKYPKLYRDYGGDPRKTCMAWGFEVNDGWQTILEELSAKITELDPDGHVVAAQVKEKFGGLRFYITFDNSADMPDDLFDKVNTLIDDAEQSSYETCEKCSKPGRQIGGGWITTLCEDCIKKLND